jgi:CBS domain-containing protein
LPGEAEMKVKNVMTEEVRTVKTTDTLSRAAMVMWDRDCGVVPVIDEERHVIGVITDRDICMAVSMRDAAASAIPVSSTMSQADGTLSGILSVGDIVRHSDKGKSRKHVAHKDAMRMLKAVSSPRQTVQSAGTSTPQVQAGTDLHGDAVASTAGK